MPDAPRKERADKMEDLLLITYSDAWHTDYLLPYLIPVWNNIRLAIDLSIPEDTRRILVDSVLSTRIEITRVDFYKAVDCERVLHGVTAVFHTGLEFHPRETELGYNIIDAAVQQDVKHFVYCSILHPELRKLPTHETKRNVEEYLTESRLKYTILQPSYFMEMFPLKELLATKELKHLELGDPGVAFSHTSTDDFVQAISVVLEEREAHYYATYQLISTYPPRTNKELCELADKELGLNLKVTPVPFGQWIDDGGLGGSAAIATRYGRDAEQRLYFYFRTRGLVGNPNVMQWILGGRAPLQWETWIARTAGLED